MVTHERKALMALPVQLSLPFACLDFPGRSTVTAGEIALKLGVTTRHILHLIEDGTIHALDLPRHSGSRSLLRVPVDEYRAFVIAKLTSATRREFIAELPPETLREIAREIAERLSALAAA